MPFLPERPQMKILVISDIHGNAEALAAVLKKEKDADAAVFLGDALLSGPQPNETVSLLESLSGILITGPHDLDILEPKRFADWPTEWRLWSQWICETLAQEGRQFLQSLKPEGEYEIDSMRVYLTHGSPPAIPGHVLPDAADDMVAALANGNDSPIVLFGHSHIQFERTINAQQFINPGSVGQNRCGRLLACYGLLVDGVFRHCQVAYDPAPWLEAMDRIAVLDEFPDFREEIKKGLLSGYGIGKREPWTRFAQDGYC